MPSLNMEDNMKKKKIDLVQFTPDMDVDKILNELTIHFLKQGWTITDDETVEEKDNG
tara:strand:+ start:292 stop:462 length:171 start_codon:yes stop_codon:yes gene_type:complete